MALSRLLRWFFIAAVMTGYAILANYTNQHYQSSYLGIVVALAPLLLAGTLIAIRSRRHFLTILLFTFAALMLWWAWPLLTQHYAWIYWIEHETLQVTLLLTFARSLFANRQPLCTQFAEILHGDTLSPAHAHYTYQVTVAWTVFFAAMVCTSTYLFFAWPIGVWSIFSNFVFLPLVFLMFVAEFVVRKWRLPEAAQVNLVDVIRTYRDNSGPRR